jgi:Spy/CpxP family protein refolding chaperone
MRKKILAIGLFSLWAVPAVMAQNQSNQTGHQRPNIATMVQQRVSRLTTLLDLTPAQQTSLTTLLTTHATNNQSLFSSMRTARQALSTAEKNNDSAGIQSASTQIGNLTAQMTANRATLNAGMAQILTADQMTKYNLLGHGRSHFRGSGSSGAPGL